MHGKMEGVQLKLIQQMSNYPWRTIEPITKIPTAVAVNLEDLAFSICGRASPAPCTTLHTCIDT
jgi:hypothetical protein